MAMVSAAVMVANNWLFLSRLKKKKKNEVTLKKKQTHCLEHSIVTNSWKKQKESWIWIKK